MSLDLSGLFTLDVGALELIVRTSIVYWSVLALMRIIARRDMGGLQLPDVLLVVLVADGVQNGMSGGYDSVTGAIVVALTLFGWNWALDWLSYHAPRFRALMRPPAVKLVADGRLLRNNMRRQLVSEDELWTHLRAQGIDALDQVKAVFLESDGELSVIRRDRAEGG